MRRLAAILIPLALTLGSCATPPVPEPVDQEIENLRAFAKLYGYIRWFHPSDEAAALDWNRFAVHGAVVAAEARNAAELEAALESLFQAVAPALLVHRADEPAAPVAECASPATGMTAWQHIGAYLGPARQALYRSYRLGRTVEQYLVTPGSFGGWMSRIDMSGHAGKSVRLSATARVTAERVPGHVVVTFRSFGKDGAHPAVSAPAVGPAHDGVVEIVTKVPADVTTAQVGGFLMGGGTAWFDDFAVSVSPDGAAWQSLSLPNAGFDAGEDEWESFGFGEYEFEIDDGAAQVRGGYEIVAIDEPLFDARPSPGVIARFRLGESLVASFPLTLPERDGHTCPQASAPALQDLENALARVSTDDPSDASTRYAAVIVAWNVMRHFYPYFDVVDVDWERELVRALEAARVEDDADGLQRALERMMATTRDGHAFVNPLTRMRTRHPLPFATGKVEGEVVVLASDLPAVQVGDVVMSVDGIPAVEVHARAAAEFAGSSQVQAARATHRFATAAIGTTANVTLRRGSEVMDIEIARSGRQAQPKPLHDVVARIGADIWYVDMGRPFDEALSGVIDELQEARGLVLDMRGYPAGDVWRLLSMVSDAPLRTAPFLLPEIIYPEYRDVGYQDVSWALPPAKTDFDGQVVFLTNGAAASASESVMGIVEHYKLGEIVGTPTAGVNGNVNRVQLPGGLDMMFTGMRVLKHDQSQLHLIGIQPTVPLEPTIAGIRAGRDEYIEKAIELIEAGGP